MKYSNSVKVWLLIGLIMVFIQVMVGGITRLTESGLSITKWEVISGTFPPMNADDWDKEFELYKNTPQYQEINEGMEIDDFKFIYFWEWVHRFWARIMGFVFLFPFLWFVFKSRIDKELISNLGVVVLLAILAATFGWIMVASGLIERPWVNAYKLSIHLMIAFAVFQSLFWAFLKTLEIRISNTSESLVKLNKLLYVFLGILIFQIFIGGVMSGMKAAVVFPTWPDMHGNYLPDIIFNQSEWNIENFNNYDKNVFMPSLIHFLHRNSAYLLFIVGLILSYRIFKLSKINDTFSLSYRILSLIFFSILFSQVLLGILTILNSVGSIPVGLGVMHQVFALLLLTVTTFTIFVSRIKK